VAFLAATVCCTVAAWPDRDWFLRAMNRIGGANRRTCCVDERLLGGEVENYQSYIDRNARHIKTNAIWLQAGLIAAALALSLLLSRLLVWFGQWHFLSGGRFLRRRLAAASSGTWFCSLIWLTSRCFPDFLVLGLSAN
jgi:hypothetical protein